MEEYTIGLDYGSLSARGVLVSTKDGSVLAECESVYKNGCITDKLPDFHAESKKQSALKSETDEAPGGV